MALTAPQETALIQILAAFGDANATLATVNEPPLDRAELAEFLTRGALNVRQSKAERQAENIRANAAAAMTTAQTAAANKDAAAAAIIAKQRSLAGS